MATGKILEAIIITKDNQHIERETFLLKTLPVNTFLLYIFVFARMIGKFPIISYDIYGIPKMQ